jgi:hypothetical protein
MLSHAVCATGKSTTAQVTTIAGSRNQNGVQTLRRGGVEDGRSIAAIEDT